MCLHLKKKWTSLKVDEIMPTFNNKKNLSGGVCVFIWWICMWRQGDSLRDNSSTGVTHLVYWDRDFHWDLSSLSRLGWLGHPLSSCCVCLHPARLTGRCHTLRLSPWCWGYDPGPHSSMESILWVEPCLQAEITLYLKKFFFLFSTYGGIVIITPLLCKTAQKLDGVFR